MRSWRMRRPPKRWSLHTKLTLTTTFCIVIASFTWFLLMEWNNKLLFAGNGVEPRLWHAMVAAVMPRSSGFDLSWMPGVSDATKVFLSIVMFIGGGSTSTAGGIRVTTFAVTLLTCRAAFTGRHDINAFHRRIHTQAVMTAVAVSTACLMLVTVVSMALMIITGCSLCDALFDTCSAFGLGGYSVGVASESSPRCYTFSPQPCSSGVSDRSPSPTRFRAHTISRQSATPPSRSWSADDTASYTCSCLQSHMNIDF